MGKGGRRPDSSKWEKQYYSSLTLRVALWWGRGFEDTGCGHQGKEEFLASDHCVKVDYKWRNDVKKSKKYGYMKHIDGVLRERGTEHARTFSL